MSPQHRRPPPSQPPPQAGEEKQRNALRGGGLIIGAAAAAVIIIAAVAAWYFLAGPGNRVTVANAPAHLSIVVLPFQNLSGDPKQDYFADVLTDELTTDLARIKGSLVIARNTAFTYKGKPVDAKQSARIWACVIYWKDRSSRPAIKFASMHTDRYATGAHVWADQFDTAHGDVLQTHDTIVTHLGRALEIQLIDIDAAQLKRTPVTNPDSEDLALRCEATVRAGGLIGDTANAGFRDCERALTTDPANVRALGWLSVKYWMPVIVGVSHDPMHDIGQADALVTRALAADPDYALAHVTKAFVLLVQRRFRRRDCPVVMDGPQLGAQSRLYPCRVVANA